SVTITSIPRLNALSVQALPRDLDNIEQFLRLIDQEASPDPPQAARVRFIPVLHGKADQVAAIVREVYAGKIVGDSASQQRNAIQPEDILRAAIMGGGGRGGRGGGGGAGGRNQQNRGEEPKVTVPGDMTS